MHNMLQVKVNESPTMSRYQSHIQLYPERTAYWGMWAAKRSYHEGSLLYQQKKGKQL